MVKLANHNLNGILADDMGLGKTIQTLSYIAYLHSEFGIKGKHLIVCPKNVLLNWETEAKKWTPQLNVVVLQATQNEREETLEKYVKKKKFDVLITTYQGGIFTQDILCRRFYW